MAVKLQRPFLITNTFYFFSINGTQILCWFNAQKAFGRWFVDLSISPQASDLRSPVCNLTRPDSLTDHRPLTSDNSCIRGDIYSCIRGNKTFVAFFTKRTTPHTKRTKPHTKRPKPHTKRTKPHTKRTKPHTKRPKPHTKRPKPHTNWYKFSKKNTNRCKIIKND